MSNTKSVLMSLLLSAVSFMKFPAFIFSQSSCLLSMSMSFVLCLKLCCCQNGRSALMIAVGVSDVELVQVLLNFGADIDVKDEVDVEVDVVVCSLSLVLIN